MRLCPWPLASSIPVLGLERVCPPKGCPWPWPLFFLCPWPRALCPRLHLCKSTIVYHVIFPPCYFFSTQPQGCAFLKAFLLPQETTRLFNRKHVLDKSYSGLPDETRIVKLVETCTQYGANCQVILFHRCFFSNIQVLTLSRWASLKKQPH